MSLKSLRFFNPFYYHKALSISLYYAMILSHYLRFLILESDIEHRRTPSKIISTKPMYSPITKQTQQLTSPQLPLGVYREVAAHLRQVEGVEVSLIMRSVKGDPTEEFDYYQSQVAAMQIHYPEKMTQSQRECIAAILNYYAERYSPWQDRSGD